MKKNNYECNDKMVSHPDHYKSDSGMEVIDVIEAFTEGLDGIEATDTGNVIKYICRWKKKNGLQDLKKAMWYLQHLIEHVEAEKEPTLSDIVQKNFTIKEIAESLGLKNDETVRPYIKDDDCSDIRCDYYFYDETEADEFVHRLLKSEQREMLKKLKENK